MKEQIEKLLKAAFQLGASDLHLTVGVPPIVRLNGDLKRYGNEPLTPEITEQMAKVVIPKEMWETFGERGDLDFSYSLPGVSRFRMNAYYQRSCISLAIRIVPTHIPSMEDLHIPPIMKKLALKPQGLILVTGPTGSGKSTTLASTINYLNHLVQKHVITLEDPIEYLHKHRSCIIDQREIGADAKNFGHGLRAALRQDPDVILVGELRDLETIQTAVTAAETGHLVLGTLHTSNAAATIDRIIDVFPPSQQSQIRVQLASVLVGILSQRLFPTPDRKSRKPAFEVLVNNSAVANLIRDGKVYQIPNVLQTSRALGMVALESSIKQLLSESAILKEAAEPYLQGE
ncbi:type IV pilus twitching motility protein PilT [Alkalihalobacillus macyae]|uniref:type IV pilus twitching motility protein PilT n=1 Tax=Guptibacillus hwajinpoensis TaxID=208199 RepID=UPI00273CE51B|nr:type IV pilus twitching motility protein PilT [Alkalihalobacillus macyae]MDP4550465.1 type IV pilus twitching motility protein PilT [Alkalihalobacillus macyae]